MSIALAKQEIRRFLSSAEPEALCLKGKWGVGKTYTWEQLLKEHAGSVALKRYGYVSLFGINTLEELRWSIVANTIPVEAIGKKPTVGELVSKPTAIVGRSWRILASLAPLASKVSTYGLKDFAALLQTASFLAVREQIICLDDLERKGETLKIKDVLGLASNLKEKRGCKIIFILNEGAFETKEKEDFDTYFEKTVDSHAIFSPTPAESVRIALPDDTPLHEELRANCEKLGISNIRVIRRIERFGRMLSTGLAQYDPAVFTDALKTVTILAWAKYDDEGPSIEFVKQYRSVYKGGNKGPSEDEKRWGPLLSEYGFLFYSDLDKVLATGIDNGFLDQQRIDEHAKALHEEVASKQLRQKFDEAWSLYHDSFKDNKAELVAALVSSFEENVKQIAPMNVNGTVRLLRGIGEDEKADELIKYYVDHAGDSAFDRSKLFSADDITDEKFEAAFDEKAAAITKSDSRKPADVLLGVARSRGWSPRDVKSLSRLSVDEFVEMFKSLEGDELSGAIRMALEFGRIGGVGENEKQIAQLATEALRKIAEESDLNKLRVSKYGVNLS